MLLEGKEMGRLVSKMTQSNPRAPPRPVSPGAGEERREFTRGNKTKESRARGRRPRGKVLSKAGK